MTEDQESLELLKRARAWMNDLATAGVGNNEITAALLSALAERMLASFGVDHTAAALRRHAELIEENGEALIGGMK